MQIKHLVHYLLGLLVGFVVLVAWQMPHGGARMIVCDVGQGDAILLTKGSNQVLVDGGPSTERLLACLTKHMPFWDRTIELIVLTNTDFDHMQGLLAVVERYRVMQFVTADGVHSSSTLSAFITALARSHLTPNPVQRGDIIYVGGRDKLTLSVLWPPATRSQYVAVFRDQMQDTVREQLLAESAKRGDLNERSVVLLVLEANERILLMGDAGDQAEKSLLDLDVLSDVDILKVGHHGSKYASSLEFLQVVRPELAVISVGAKNRYGHPTAETLARLTQVGATIHRTDQEGEIVVPLGIR